MGKVFAERNRRSIPVLLGLLTLNICALAQEFPTAKPESVGLSASAKRIERYIIF
jgi:hypothetical protein